MRPAKLSESEVKTSLDRFPEWLLDSDIISRTYTFSTFTKSLEFVNQLAEAAESVQHHPDIDIRYNKVKIALTTHDVAGLTKNDFDLAAYSDDLAGALNGPSID
jgi:4a-hydroxytetrahydrobiopterin dehydratase